MQRQMEAGWSNPKVLAIFALIFCCGLALGAVAASTPLHRAMVSKPRNIQAAEGRGLDRLKRELNLSSEQARFVTKELDDYAKYYQNIEEEREDVAEHGKQRILGILTPEQKKRFLEIFKSPPLPTGTEEYR